MTPRSSPALRAGAGFLLVASLACETLPEPAAVGAAATRPPSLELLAPAAVAFAPRAADGTFSLGELLADYASASNTPPLDLDESVASAEFALLGLDQVPAPLVPRCLETALHLAGQGLVPSAAQEGTWEVVAGDALTASALRLSADEALDHLDHPALLVETLFAPPGGVEYWPHGLGRLFPRTTLKPDTGGELRLRGPAPEVAAVIALCREIELPAPARLPAPEPGFVLAARPGEALGVGLDALLNSAGAVAIVPAQVARQLESSSGLQAPLEVRGASARDFIEALLGERRLYARAISAEGAGALLALVHDSAQGFPWGSDENLAGQARVVGTLTQSRVDSLARGKDLVLAVQLLKESVDAGVLEKHLRRGIYGRDRQAVALHKRALVLFGPADVVAHWSRVVADLGE